MFGSGRCGRAAALPPAFRTARARVACAELVHAGGCEAARIPPTLAHLERCAGPVRRARDGIAGMNSRLHGRIMGKIRDSADILPGFKLEIRGDENLPIIRPASSGRDVQFNGFVMILL